MHAYVKKILSPQIGIAVVAILLSLSYSFFLHPPLNVDAKAHNRIALNLLHGNGYIEQLPFNSQFDDAITRSGPLLEFFLAGLYAIFGTSLGVVWIAHALMHGFSAYMVYVITKMLFSRENEREHDVLFGYHSALLASALYALYPDLIESSSQLMTETTFFALTLLCVYLFLRYMRHATWRMVCAVSACFSLVFLAKSTALLYYPVFFIYIWFKNKSHACVSVLIVCALISPWVIRNYEVFHKIIPSRIFADYTLYVGNHHGASGENDIELLPDAKDVKSARGVFAVDDYSHTKFIQFIHAYPWEYIGLHFRRLSVYFSWLRPTGHWSYLTSVEKRATFISSGIFSVIVFTLGIAGLLYATIRRKVLEYWILGALAVITPVPFILTVVETRYRYQIYPFLIIFAGYMIATLLLNKTKDSKALMYTAFVWCVLLANTLVDFGLNYHRFVALLLTGG